ncbi:MAG: hypothetical protein F4Z74_11845 [Acidobacteria bacterium]|nr:hypothetical protein [Acidobacteriota bacterium]MYE42488.1 hypothetical protein [Acidobacteriota bacterium]
MTAIAHLAGREAALEPLGWTGRDATWLALVCLHSGVFLRSQFVFQQGCSSPTAHRFVKRLLQAAAARERPLSPDRGRASEQCCHITARPLYRALDIEHVRHRRVGSPGLLFRRLLALDYVIEHPDLPWLPTEHEKVARFTALGIPSADLPQRSFRGAVAPTRRYFAVTLPVAADERAATFVYTVSGSRDLNALRYWGETHQSLWTALRRGGRTVQVVAVTRTSGHARSIGKKLAKWCGPPPAAQEITPPEQELMDDVQRARETRNWRILDKWGGVNAVADALEAIESRKDASAPRGPSIDSCSTHVAERLAPDSLTLP